MSVSSAPEDLKALAESLIGQPVSELYKAIGQPLSADYSPSCLDLDTDDGELVYDWLRFRFGLGFCVRRRLAGDLWFAVRRSLRRLLLLSAQINMYKWTGAGFNYIK